MNDKIYFFSKQKGVLICLLLFVLFLNINIVKAVPPVSNVQQFSEGFALQVPEDNVLVQNKPFEFDIHVYNISNGHPVISGVTCYLHVYDHKGNHLYNGFSNTVTNTYDYSFTINGNNFTNLGKYYFNAECNSSTLGGYSSNVLEVTPVGNNNNTGFFIIVIALVYIVAFVGFFGKNEWVSIIGGMGMIALGLYMINNGIVIYRDFITNVISWITIGIGSMFSLMAGVSLIQENM